MTASSKPIVDAKVGEINSGLSVISEDFIGIFLLYTLNLHN